MGLGDMLGEDLSQIANSETANTQTEQDVVNAGAADTLASSTLPNAPLSKDSGIDSSVIEQALGQIKRVDDALAAEGEERPEGQDEEEAEGDEPAVDTKPAKKELTPYQKRVQGLIQREKQARDEIARVTQYYAQQMQDMQQQIQARETTERNELLMLQRRQLEMAERRTAEDAERALPEHERARLKFVREIESKAEQAALSKLSPKVQELEDKLAARERAEQERAAQDERAKMYQNWNSQAQNALQKTLLAGFDPKDAQELAPELEEMLFAYAGAFGLEPMQAAPYFKSFLQRTFKAEAKRVSKGAGAKVAAGKAATQPLPSGRAGGGTKGLPTLAELRVDGRYENHVQYFRAGSPALSARK